MPEQAQVMVVTAHPDDAEFGAAGTVAHWVREGKNVVYVACTSGEKGTSDLTLKSDDLADIREREQVTAAKLLGVKDVIFLHFPDQGLEDTSEFRKEIVRQIRIYRPETVVVSDPYRRYVWHRDHRIAGQVTLDAIFPFARDHLAYPELLTEGLLPHKVREVLLWATEEPNYYSDITDTFIIKIAALRCHHSQLGDDQFPVIEKWVKERAKKTAVGKGFEMAEAFHREEIWW
ncbi:PIG-L deacetylase family protein [Chloroflexota bacterium]